jgi:peptidoglycan/LPS O-acetylase OafA/YrhL
MKHLPAIDGLRAIAVLAVVAYHAGLPVPAGFVGVDVFFVISGYVITRMLAAEHAQTGRIDFAAFYARRVRRILPALVIVVAATLAGAAMLLSADQQMAVNRSAMASMAFAANVHFQAVTGGYWDANAEQMPLLHLWSLAVEEQFYFVWPLLLVVLLRLRRGPWMLAGLGAASFALAQHWGDTEVAFYQMPFRFWELAAGGLIALSPQRSRPIAAYAGLAFLAIAVLVKLPDFPGTGAVPAVLGAALVLHAAHGGLRIATIELRPVRYVGLISYSLYLWHWPLLALAKAYSMDPPPLWANLLLCGAAFILAALSYRFVETPFRRNRAPSFKAIGVGLAACLALAGCSGATEYALLRSDSLSVRTALDGPKESAWCQGVDATCEADVVLWGDSHAKAWEPLAERYGRVHQLTWPGCIASTRHSQNDACAQFNAKALPIARQAPTVILGGFWLRRLGGIDERRDFESALAALNGQHVIVVGPTPELHVVPQACIRVGDFAPCTIPRAEYDERAAPVRAYIQRILARYPKAEYIDPADFFCTPTVCPMMRDGYSLYWDANHISASAAQGFARSRGTLLSAE